MKLKPSPLSDCADNKFCYILEHKYKHINTVEHQVKRHYFAEQIIQFQPVLLQEEQEDVTDAYDSFQ